jgi:hypothetical protein
MSLGTLRTKIISFDCSDEQITINEMSIHEYQQNLAQLIKENGNIHTLTNIMTGQYTNEVAEIFSRLHFMYITNWTVSGSDGTTMAVTYENYCRLPYYVSSKLADAINEWNETE